jgi:SAM-dependent methyltransferase
MSFEERCRKAVDRVTGKVGLEPILDLGMMPHADGLLTADQLAAIQAGKKVENKWPLELGFSPASGLVQITETVDPSILFGADYPYFSSFSDAWLKHCRENALNLIKTRNLNSSSFVVELASNDGYMLKNFVEAGIKVQGIDPAPGPAAAATKIGVPTVCDFFTLEMAKKMAREGKKADVVIGNNVMAHVADTNGFVQGIREILKDDGTTSIEAPYVKDMIEHGEFDTIYHQHLCYFSVHSADALFRHNGLFLNHVEWLSTHGGSLRYYAGKRENVQASVRMFLAEEKALGMDKAAYYRGFATSVKNIGATMRSLLADIKRQGKRIAAYGAAAKGAIMINYLGADTSVLDYCVDRNVHKQGRFMPGMHIPILPVEELVRRQPEYCVILPWNFKDEILRQQDAYRKAGGRFIVPVPTPVIA